MVLDSFYFHTLLNVEFLMVSLVALNLKFDDDSRVTGSVHIPYSAMISFSVGPLLPAVERYDEEPNPDPEASPTI